MPSAPSRADESADDWWPADDDRGAHVGGDGASGDGASGEAPAPAEPEDTTLRLILTLERQVGEPEYDEKAEALEKAFYEKFEDDDRWRRDRDQDEEEDEKEGGGGGASHDG